MTTITLRWEAAALAAVGLLVAGAASGLLVQAEPVTKAPHQCRVMATTAVEIFDLWDELTHAVNDRGDALDKDTYRIHDAEVRHLEESRGAVEPTYTAAVAGCLGEGR